MVSLSLVAEAAGEEMEEMEEARQGLRVLEAEEEGAAMQEERLERSAPF